MNSPIIETTGLCKVFRDFWQRSGMQRQRSFECLDKRQSFLNNRRWQKS